MLLARVLDGGEYVATRDGDVGVGLVVLVIDVEIRMVLGDELAFEDERLMLAFDDDVVEARNELHHERDLCAIVGQRDVLAQASA